MLVPLRSERTRLVVIAALIIIIVGASLVGGRAAGVFTGLMAACSLDFFHLRPYVHLGLVDAPFYLSTVVFVGLGAVVGARRRAEAPDDDTA